jgi:hypothetical protein
MPGCLDLGVSWGRLKDKIRFRQSVRSGVCRREVVTIGLKNRREREILRCHLIPWKPEPGVLFLPFGDGKAAKGMQRQNIAVNRLCTGNGSTEAE